MSAPSTEVLFARCHDECVRLLAREEAWEQLVEYLILNRGFAPPGEATGLWVDLYDEVTGAGAFTSRVTDNDGDR